MNSAVFLAAFGHSSRCPSLFSSAAHQLYDYDTPLYNPSLAIVPPSYYALGDGIQPLATTDQTSLAGFFDYYGKFSWYYLSPVGRLGETFPFGRTVCEAENSPYANVNIIIPGIQSPTTSLSGATARIWLPSDDYLEKTAKTASVSSVRQATFTGANFPPTASFHDFIDGKALVGNKSLRSSLILRAGVGLNQDGTKLILKKPWTACSFTAFGFLGSAAPGQSLPPRFADNQAFLPTAATAKDSHTTRGRNLEYASHAMIIDKDTGGSPNEDRLLVIANRLLYVAYNRLYSIEFLDREKAAVVRKNSTGELFATYMIGWDLPISGGRLVINQPGITQGANYREDPVAYSILPAYRLARNNSEIDEPFPPSSYMRRVSAFSFAAFSSQPAASSQPALAAAVGNRPQSEIAATLTRIESAAVGASQGDAMLERRRPFDFGEKCVRSTVSTALPKLNEYAAEDFLQQQLYGFNSEGVIGLGNSAAGLEPESSPSGQSVAFKKAASDRLYSQQTEQWSLGDFASEGISLVELLSSAMLASQPPIQDSDTEFPIITGASQGSAFVFRGKRVTGTGVSFTPWSSNSFFSRVGAAASQETQPSVSLPAQSPFSEVSNTSFGEPPISGKFHKANSQVDIWEHKFSVPQPQLGAGATKHYYRLTTWDSAPASRPLPQKTYYPNQEFDEHGYMAGAVCRMMPSPQYLGRVQQGAEWPSIYGFTEGQFIDRNPMAFNSVSGTFQRVLGSDTSKPNLTLLNPYDEYFDTPPAGASIACLPSLAGKEFDCVSDYVLDTPLQAGCFHFLGEGESFEKKVLMNFKGMRFTLDGDQNGYARTYSEWSGSEEHTCTFDTKVVEIYVKWSASLQSPGAYSVRPPYPATYDDVNIETGPSIVAPRMFVKSSQVDGVTPILVAEVWVRAVGSVDVSTEYQTPPEIGTSGAVGHGAFVNTIQAGNGSVAGRTIADISDSKIGHITVLSSSADQEVPASQVLFRYLGALPFNREQTQRLLDGEAVTPTYWFLDDEGSDLESQPICVAWHNASFGTYKLEFRLVTGS